MSWNKNTVVISEINATINTLKALNVPYKLTVMGEVMGMGLNDEDGAMYQIRRLEYADRVVLEQMSRSPDCDADDYLISASFHKDEVPANWKLEVEPDPDV